TREEAIARMERAIDDYAIAGVETTLTFCRFTMSHPAFRSGTYDTHFVRDHFKPGFLLGTDAEEQAAAALVAGHLAAQAVHRPAHTAPNGALSPWRTNRR
ncbi:MAG: biotin carboxylase, partial [Flavobacteriales bacterium]|nr:biotin carboxylase [Flavobacteriales bacterium]